MNNDETTPVNNSFEIPFHKIKLAKVKIQRSVEDQFPYALDSQATQGVLKLWC